MIIRRHARNDFVALRICETIDDYNGTVFSVTHDGVKYIVWANIHDSRLSQLDAQLDHVYMEPDK
jgi:hypothetical protein